MLLYVQLTPTDSKTNSFVDKLLNQHSLVHLIRLVGKKLFSDYEIMLQNIFNAIVFIMDQIGNPSVPAKILHHMRDFLAPLFVIDGLQC